MSESPQSSPARSPSPSDRASSPASKRSDKMDSDKMDSDDEDIVPKRKQRRTNGVASDDDEDMGGASDKDDAGLFGSEDDMPTSPKRRRLSDEELDSGDDMGRKDRLFGEDDEDVDMEMQQREQVVAQVAFQRQAVPKGTDGELYILRTPHFASIEPKAFNAPAFQPPTSSHHGTKPTAGFSALAVANNTIRWRRDPKDQDRLQSNARIIRWSDGSLTLQIASNATEQYQLPAKPLAPPQHNPRKPTPTSINDPKAPPRPFNPAMDSYTYLARIHEEEGFAQMAAHLTASLTVQATNAVIDEDDDALIRLQERMAAAVRSNRGGRNATGDGAGGAGDNDDPTQVGPAIVETTEDPELAKRKAEAAEREKLKAEKRRANQEMRERQRSDRAFGRVGVKRSYGGAAGLSLEGLEDDEEGGMGGRRGAGRAPPRRRRRDDYSDDEEDGYRRGKTREDEYDKDDGFLVGSDEEEEEDAVGESDEEVIDDERDAEGEDDDEMDTRPSKRSSGKSKGGDDGGRRKRRVVSDDDDD